MSQEQQEDASGISAAMSAVADVAGTALTGIPAPVQRGLTKAIERLCLAAVELPVAYLETRATNLRAQAAGKTLLASRVAERLADGVQVSKEASDVAAGVWIEKIIGRQQNLDAVAAYALQHAAAEAVRQSDAGNEVPEDGEISDDWLNVFEREAENASSEDMRFAFGKILAGEAKRPGDFSTRTVKLLTQLPPDVAAHFQRLCGMVTYLTDAEERITDARVWSLDNHVGMNGLAEYGLSYTTCTELVEAGLVVPTLDTMLDYTNCVLFPTGHFGRILVYQGVERGLIWRDQDSPLPSMDISGLALTRSGRELLRIVDGAENEAYNDARAAFLAKMGFDTGIITWVERGKRYSWAKDTAPATGA